MDSFHSILLARSAHRHIIILVPYQLIILEDEADQRAGLHDVIWYRPGDQVVAQL